MTAYAIRPLEEPDVYQVAKFEDEVEPTSIYTVRRIGGVWSCDAPSYWQMRERDKHIRLVLQFIQDGEPPLCAYTINGDAISGRRFA